MKDIYLDKLIEIGEKDNNIKIIAMNGSRVDKNREKDIFQDYDIVYLLNSLKEFNIEKFLNNFGEIAIIQEPGPPSLFNNSYTYLIQFTDGNRIDLRIIELKVLEEYLKEDSLTKIILDKDNIIKKEILPNDSSFWNKKPSYEEYYNLCNEFLWISLYIAKAMVRDEFIYCRKLLDENYRTELIKLLEWKVGIEKGFDFTLGKYGSYLNKYLSEEDWNRLYLTYDDNNYEKIWNILFSSLEFFKEIGLFVGDKFNYNYPLEDHKKVLELLNFRKLYYEKNKN